jgi:ATP-dependent helicase HrpB
LVLQDKPLNKPDPEKVKVAMLAGLRQRGLPWTDELRAWRQRIAFLRQLDPNWPDLSDAALAASLDDWLAPFVDGAARRIGFVEALNALVPWEQQRQLDKLAPTHLEVPSGSRVQVDYANAAEPALSVRLQEMFGLTDTPRIAGGKVPVTIHLLSPARRPVQVTRDLASFWKNAYRDVKAELKGRYPKHYWPDDPLIAEPTARAKPRR